MSGSSIGKFFTTVFLLDFGSIKQENLHLCCSVQSCHKALISDLLTDAAEPAAG